MKSKTGIFALFLKLGPKIFSVFTKLLKSLKVVKVGLAVATFGGYAILFSWKFALLLMAALAFHESGHVWAMKKMGIKTKGFYFIPFLGGAAVAEEKYKTYGENAYVSLMGPIWGAGLALIAAGVYAITGNHWWGAASAWMALLNLFNLLPIHPLDGGQILRSICFSINNKTGIIYLSISIIICLICFKIIGAGLLILMLFIGTLDLVFEYRIYRKFNSIKKLIEQLKLNGKLNETQYQIELNTMKTEYGSRPDPMDKKKLGYTIFSYVILTIVLLVLVNLFKHIPGADLAHTFLS